MSQCVAVWCSVVQCVVASCVLLDELGTVYCGVLQCVAICCDYMRAVDKLGKVCCRVLQGDVGCWSADLSACARVYIRTYLYKYTFV